MLTRKLISRISRSTAPYEPAISITLTAKNLPHPIERIRWTTPKACSLPILERLSRMQPF